MSNEKLLAAYCLLLPFLPFSRFLLLVVYSFSSRITYHCPFPRLSNITEVLNRISYVTGFEESMRRAPHAERQKTAVVAFRACSLRGAVSGSYGGDKTIPCIPEGSSSEVIN